MTRDEMTRCPICKKLFADMDCILDTSKGYKCPNGCEPTYKQEPYESPMNDE